MAQDGSRPFIHTRSAFRFGGEPHYALRAVTPHSTAPHAIECIPPCPAENWGACHFDSATPQAGVWL